MPKIKLAIASDHAGINLKKFLLENCKEAGMLDLGPASLDSVDYPDFAKKACSSLLKGDVEKVILVCGSGVGMSIAANKISGIRAAHVESIFTAQLAGEHNQANVLCLGERVTGSHHALAMVNAWLKAKFGGENTDSGAISRHQKRIDKIKDLEK